MIFHKFTDIRNLTQVNLACEAQQGAQSKKKKCLNYMHKYISFDNRHLWKAPNVHVYVLLFKKLHDNIIIIIIFFLLLFP